ncbi:MAG: chemotaxis protein CheA [Pseudobacteriovorax sp.]|nr:chemotaxis protein CheA [Pseudobacteriovorax sp.]
MNDVDFIGIFLDEAEDLLQTWESSCLEVEKELSAEAINELFRVAHNMKGSSASVGLNEFSSFVHKIEDTITLFKDDLSLATPDRIGLLFECLDIFQSWISGLRDDIEHKEATQDILDRIMIKPFIKNESTASFGFFDEPTKSAEEPDESNHNKDLGTLLIESGHATPEQIEQAATIQQRPIGEVLVAEGLVPKEAVEQTIAKQKKQQKGKVDETIRISANKLDELMRLVGELSTQQSIISHAFKSNTMDSAICRKAISLSEKNLKDVQSFALNLRMQPLSQLFQRMERIIRDTGRKQEKLLSLSINGESVELDKSIIEKIKDPLVHLVRNAVDHGLEPNEDRLEIGKNQTGHLSLTAYQEANAVNIVVEDDGKGMDPNLIYQKAVDKGLTQRPRESLSDSEIFKFILMPNFSTKEEVTDISGRGVGMNVVKETVDKIGGQLKIASELGKGTKFLISLPTNVSIAESILVSIDHKPYAIPILELKEIINLREYEIQQRTQKGRMVCIRNKVYPLVDLGEFLPDLESCHIPTTPNSVGLILQIEEEQVVFSIDSILGQQSVVIRALEGKLADLKIFAGACILGTGEPSMIIDMNQVGREYINRQ